MNMNLIFLLGLSLFLINCSENKQGSDNDQGIDIEAFIKQCNDLDEFKNCVNQINSQSSVSKTALTLDFVTCASSHIIGWNNLLQDHGIENQWTPEESSKKDKEWKEVGNQCFDKASNQEMKACMINAVTVFRRRACQQVRDW